MKAFLLALAACASGIALVGMAGLATGHRDLLPILLDGSVGTRFALAGSILKAVPLLLTGIAVVIAFRAGVWNIGGEGQFIVGALGALLGSRYGVVAALAASLVAGALWASMAALMRLWRNAPEVLTTILLNFIAVHLLGYCVNGPLQEASRMYPQSEAVPESSWLPALPGTTLHAGVVLALVLAAGSWLLLYRTREGLRLRATGFNPSAARHAGIKVGPQLIRAMALSGAAAGLAGGIELLGVTHRLFERFASGYGYSGIAVALLAQLDPLAAIGSSLFFGALVTGAGELQRTANISSSVATLTQAMVILVLIVFAAIGRTSVAATARIIGRRADAEGRES